MDPQTSTIARDLRQHRIRNSDIEEFANNASQRSPGLRLPHSPILHRHGVCTAPYTLHLKLSSRHF